MDPRLRRLAPAAYTLYAWVFLAVGALGVLGAGVEIERVHGVRGLSAQTLTDLTHQLRFLRGAEAGLGALLLAVKEPFFAPAVERSPINRAALLALLAVPLARTVSLVLDGAPSPVWTGFLVVEWALFMGLRRATEPRALRPPRPPTPAE